MYDAIVSWSGQAESLKIEKMRKGIPPSHSILFILAKGQVRASAGDLAVHGALLACVCVCVCVCVCECVSEWVSEWVSVCVCVSVWVSGIKLLSRHATNRDKVCFCRDVSTRQLANCHGFLSPLCLDRAATVHPQKHFRVSVFFRQYSRRMPSEPCSWLEKRRINRSTSKRSNKKLERAAITAFFLDRFLAVVHCDRSWPDDRWEQWPLLSHLPVRYW